MKLHARGRQARTLVPLGGALLLAICLSGPSMAPLPARAGPALYFSEDGKQTTDFGYEYDTANAVAIQPDGKTLVAGTALARYNEDGSLDTSFAQAGTQNTGVGSADGLALQPDGKILVVGDIEGDLALARFSSDGTIDTSFADDGMGTTDIDGQQSVGRGVALQADGKIVAAGIVDTEDGFQYLVARYNTEGLLDGSFGDGGFQLTNVGASFARAVAVQADDKIVVAGGSLAGEGDPNVGSGFGVVRLTSDGMLDDTFSDDGIQTTAIGDWAEASDVAIQSDGRIVVAGGTSHDGFALARYNSDGALDDTFSEDGIRVADPDHLDFVATAVTLQADGKIVAGGMGYGPEGVGQNFAVARFQPNGNWDNTFAEDGLQGTDFGADEIAHDATLRPDGKITLVGQTDHDGRKAAVARYNPDGSLDAAPPVPPPGPPTSTDPEPTPTPSKACTITGTARGEVIHGTSGRDVICARGGSDTVYGHGGHDLVFGHRGYDRLYGGTGNDRLHGARDRDELVGGTGSDLLRGGLHGDRLNTRDRVRGNDSAYGGYGNDSCATNRRDLRRSC